MKDFPDVDELFREILNDMALGIESLPRLREDQIGTEILDVVRLRALGVYVRLESTGREAADALYAYPEADVEVFAPSYARANLVLRRITSGLVSYPRRVQVEGRIYGVGRATQTRGVTRLPFNDQQVRRVGATYQLSLTRGS